MVIMGETGCGKTRLIRFMCDLAAQGTGKGNMLIMKVRCILLHVPLADTSSFLDSGLPNTLAQFF